MDGEYLGHQIHVEAGRLKGFRGLGAFADVSGPGREEPFRFDEQLDRMAQHRSTDWPDDDEEATERLIDRALHRARGAILLDRLSEIDGQSFRVLVQQPPYAERSDEYLRSLILNAFKRVFRQNPAGRGEVAFDDIGVALMENVHPNGIEYILIRLEGDGLIQATGMGHYPGANPYVPTPAGLAEADQLAVPARAPGLLVEESVALVDSKLNRLAPDLVARLSEQSVRIAESKELSEVEIREIGQSCHHILVEFLDLDALWDNFEGTRPDKELTRERLRAILKTRATSETERDLLPALEQYLVGWVAKFGEFVQKYRHVAPDTNRRQAKRMVVYTYLLLADLIELLAL